MTKITLRDYINDYKKKMINAQTRKCELDYVTLIDNYNRELHVNQSEFDAINKVLLDETEVIIDLAIPHTDFVTFYLDTDFKYIVNTTKFDYSPAVLYI